jgi:hypothetical protein
MIDPLKSMASKRAMPYPDVKTRDVHKEAAREGHA